LDQAIFASYTYVGIHPQSDLARYTLPDPWIPKHIDWSGAPDTWWQLVEDLSWETWVTQHLPTVIPGCSLPAPPLSAVSKP
jgi:hypothetical protein